MSKRLVIDTVIFGAAGGPDAEGRAKTCFDVLTTVRQADHRLVLSPDLWDEWRRHRSTSSRAWLTSMYARRNVIIINDVTHPSLRTKFARLKLSNKEHEAAEKDLHLLEAALAADKIVLSMDEIVRDIFSRATSRVSECRRVIWVNPERAREACIEWLIAGAPFELHRCLGHRPSE